MIVATAIPYLRLFLALLCLVPFSVAQAVSLSADGTGQALIYPYYTVQGTQDTLFSVQGGSSSKALKVRFFEGRNGSVALNFNLYLAKFTTWTAAVTRDAAGNPVLRTFDPACTVPRFGASSIAGATEIAFTNANYAGYDMAGSGLDRAREGHFEIIEMGNINESFMMPYPKTFGGAITPFDLGYETANPNFDCSAVASAWDKWGIFLNSTGHELLAPTGGLQGHAFIINVPRSTEYSYDPVALSGVFTNARHTAAGDTRPNLGDADPTSLVVANGIARQSTWSTGIDAVSAVLTHSQISNEYVGPPTASAPVSTDVIVTFPTKSYYVVRESDTGLSTRPPFTAKFNTADATTGIPLADGASRGACEFAYEDRRGRGGLFNSYSGFIFPEWPGPWPYDPNVLCWQANVVSIGNVLDSPTATNLANLGSYNKTTSGTIRFQFYVSADSRPSLTSLEGHQYPGLPVVGFAAQQRINGNLGGLLANYGGTSAHKYVTELK